MQLTEAATRGVLQKSAFTLYVKMQLAEAATRGVLQKVHLHFTLKCSLQRQPPEVFCKKGFLRNFAKFTGKQPCQRNSERKGLWKKTLPQVFSCCKILQNAFFVEHLGWLILNLQKRV